MRDLKNVNLPSENRRGVPVAAWQHNALQRIGVTLDSHRQACPSCQGQERARSGAMSRRSPLAANGNDSAEPATRPAVHAQSCSWNAQ